MHMQHLSRISLCTSCVMQFCLLLLIMPSHMLTSILLCYKKVSAWEVMEVNQAHLCCWTLDLHVHPFLSAYKCFSASQSPTQPPPTPWHQLTILRLPSIARLGYAQKCRPSQPLLHAMWQTCVIVLILFWETLSWFLIRLCYATFSKLPFDETAVYIPLVHLLYWQTGVTFMLGSLMLSFETCLLLHSPVQLLHRHPWLLNLISMLLTLSVSAMHWILSVFWAVLNLRRAVDKVNALSLYL